MIGPALGVILRIAAYGMIVLGFARGIELLYPFALGWPSPFDVWRGIHHAAWSVIGGIVQGGVLLALLSIDKRIQHRDT